MKVLIVANTIYPHNQPRAFRATELAKQIARQGHEVHLYGVLGKYDYKEFEQKYNLSVNNIGPMRFFPLNSDDNDPHYTLWRKILGKIGGRLLAYPGIEFIQKIPKVLQEQHNADLLITLAPSHAIHWGTAIAKKKLEDFPKVWIADCGDPFMGRNLYPFYFKYLENYTFSQANWITIPIKNARKAYDTMFHHKIKIIPQGFDFNEVELNHSHPENKVPTFIYAGVFYKEIRDPTNFLQYLSQINKPFKFRLFTRENSIVNKFKNILEDRLEINPFIPREKLLVEMNNADFLVNFNNKDKTQSPSKLIDYAIVDRPILNIEQGHVNKNIIDEFLEGIYTHQYIIDNVNQYRIENVVQKFLDLYKETIRNTY